MPDWQKLVEERLGQLKLSPVCEREVVAELAGHLEERRAALRQGTSDSEAVALVLEEVPDWAALNAEISATRREEDCMTEHTKTIVIPGMTMLILASILGFLALNLIPPATWVAPNAPVVAPAIWLGAYCVLGALGAYWSRRVGGNVRARFFSGVFPVALHAVIFGCVFVATVFGYARADTGESLLNASARIIVGFVVIPGVALAVGALPFLRDGKHRTAPLPAVR